MCIRSGAAFFTAMIVAATAAGCGRSGEQQSPATGDMLTATVSIRPQLWLVERVGGEHVDVSSLLSPGDSPATYQPTDAQISRVMQSKVYFRIGVPFENGRWFQAIESTGGPTIVDLRRGIEMRHMQHRHGREIEEYEEPAADREESDPHIWLSPRLLKIQAATVAGTLSEIDTAHARDYRANLQRLVEELDRVDVYIRDRLSSVRGRTFFVFHPAWGYFADEYGLRQEAIEIEGKEPSDHDLTEFQARAQRENIRVIFVQPQISSEVVEAVARAIGAEVRVLDPLLRDVAFNLRAVADVLAEILR